MTSRNLVGVVCLVALCGCGKGVSKLTDEQKAILKNTVSSAETAFQAPSEARKQGPGELRVYAIGEEDVATQTKMASKIQKGLSSGQCVDQTKQASPSSTPGFGGSFPSIKISGAQCPVIMEMTMQAKEKSVTFHLSYKVQDAEFLKLNDINEASFDFTANQESNDSASANFKGSLNGQKGGNVVISGNFKQSPKSLESMVRFEFPTFAAEIAANRDSKGVVKYTLNGEELTEAQLEEYLGKMGKNLSGNTGGGSNPSNDGSVPQVPQGNPGSYPYPAPTATIRS